MHKLSLKCTVACVGLAFIAGCGDSGGGSDDVARSSLNLGTTSTELGRNGIPFAGEMDELPELAVGDSFDAKITVLRVTSPEGGTSTSVSPSDETITLTKTGESSVMFTLTYDGQEVSLNPDDFDGWVELPDGRILEFYDGSVGGGSFLIELVEFDEEEDLIGTSYTVLGMETNPETLVALGNDPDIGSVFYSGDFIGAGATNEAGVTTGPLEIIYGDVYIEASFADMLMDGEIDMRDYDGDDMFSLEFEGAAIVGNGFGTSDVDVSCGELSCDGTAEIGGAFFGENADSVGGLVEFDVSSPDSDVSLSGGGGFHAEEYIE